MKEQNSYAYISNPNKNTVKREGSVINVSSRISPEKCIKEIFEKETIEELENKPTKLVFKTKVNIDPDLFEVKVTIYKVKKSFYVDFEVDGKTRLKAIKCLEYIHEKLEKSELNTKSDYIQVITYDAISEYYCDKIYPVLSGFERNLRHLLLNIYLVYFEQDYYIHQFDESFEAKIKSGVQAKGNTSRKAIVIIQEAFYSLDFKTIEDMLFTEKFTKYEAEKIEKVLSKVEDLSTLSDSELRSIISSFLPKSDWERFFADKINGSDFKELFKRIRNNRNKVAHQKFFYKEDYLVLKEDLKVFTNAIDQAIRITKDKDFSKQNLEYVRKSFEGLQEMIQKAFKPAFESIGEITLEFSEAATKIASPFANVWADMAKIYLPKFGGLIDEDESDPEIEDEDTD